MVYGIAALACSLAVLFLAALMVGRALDRLRQEKAAADLPQGPYPCYRCGHPAVTEYMGLHYCLICRDVVVALIGAVQHDPPFGFPGSPGYLKPVPGLEEKKED